MMVARRLNFSWGLVVSRSQQSLWGKKFLISAVVSLITFLGMGCQGPSSAVAPLESGTSEHRVYTLGPGDKLRVTVFQHEEISGEFEVDSVGRMALPLIRGVKAEGLTIPELEQTITDRLEQNHFIEPKVSVDLIRSRPFCVLGEVRNPGCFNYVYGMRAAMAIATAGGYSYRAREREFVVTREDGTKVAAHHDTPIFPGDVITVSERFF